MNPQPRTLLRATCQYRKENGQFCKRSVNYGEDKCWQHAGWSHKWKSLTGSQTIGFFAGVASILGLILAIGLLFRHSLTKQEIAQEVVKQLPAPPKTDAEKSPASSIPPTSQQQNSPPPVAKETKGHKVKGNKNVIGNNVNGNGNMTGNDNNSPVTVAPGGIVNNGSGTITSPTINNYPRANPLDPLDGEPDAKLADEAIQMGTEFLRSQPGCEEHMREAYDQDTRNKDPNHSQEAFAMGQLKLRVLARGDDIKKMHESLIYRLGPLSKDMSAESTLDILLRRESPLYLGFNCSEYKTVGEYFNKLGSQLKSKAEPR